MHTVLQIIVGKSRCVAAAAARVRRATDVSLIRLSILWLNAFAVVQHCTDTVLRLLHAGLMRSFS